ncbi:MAG TPA: hypothetical protein VNH18_33445 [Bryobacteraceae bacterium]|nr:hypothetical protein [Bryobacteraceae bacterium]
MAGKGGKREGAGRKPGVPNKLNSDLKAMILGALEGAGGQDYLQRQAEENPGAFLTLIGKVLPTTLAGSVNTTMQVVTGVPREEE